MQTGPDDPDVGCPVTPVGKVTPPRQRVVANDLGPLLAAA